ncbi:hypothetical protein LTR62_003194 [Meristemomyces frigidus]|uniref:Uncharacterized protein n=1 Tax=Meristemomyces frigidus TaxID=1508187 RepID=A0AAN7TLI8_9PEZI|nr:hypothetical protein LTR62_003194 [Meristemomyces frigidus]
MDPLPHPAIVLLIIIGVAIAVAIGYAIWSLFHGHHETPATTEPSNEQAGYMREVRLRNQDFMAKNYGRKF